MALQARPRARERCKDGARAWSQTNQELSLGHPAPTQPLDKLFFIQGLEPLSMLQKETPAFDYKENWDRLCIRMALGGRSNGLGLLLAFCRVENFDGSQETLLSKSQYTNRSKEVFPPRRRKGALFRPLCCSRAGCQYSQGGGVGNLRQSYNCSGAWSHEGAAYMVQEGACPCNEFGIWEMPRKAGIFHGQVLLWIQLPHISVFC